MYIIGYQILITLGERCIISYTLLESIVVLPDIQLKAPVSLEAESNEIQMNESG